MKIIIKLLSLLIFTGCLNTSNENATSTNNLSSKNGNPESKNSLASDNEFDYESTVFYHDAIDTPFIRIIYPHVRFLPFNQDAKDKDHKDRWEIYANFRYSFKIDSNQYFLISLSELDRPNTLQSERYQTGNMLLFKNDSLVYAEKQIIPPKKWQSVFFWNEQPYFIFKTSFSTAEFYNVHLRLATIIQDSLVYFYSIPAEIDSVIPPDGYRQKTAYALKDVTGDNLPEIIVYYYFSPFNNSSNSSSEDSLIQPFDSLVISLKN